MDTLIRTSKPRRWFQPKSNSKASDTAFIFHTSGTSTGLPKPIFQSHKAALGVLPVLDGQQNATFTTTPLYHGGIADCLTAWTSNALIWLFPASDVPITSKNIRSSLSAAKRASLEQSVAEIKYFSCVPYLLQMLVEEPQGIRILQGMEIVGVGGAALNKSTGSQLVKDGIRLVSRFGSAECGFLLSSHREYDEDKEWEYFRLPPNNKSLVFEEQDGSSKLSELVVKAGWPHMTKVNRPNGNFATSDLFEPHPKVKGAWRHHSRSDSQITLSTGMKFDPEPLENLVASSSSLIREVLVFGSGRQDPGILVFLSSESMGMNAPALDEEIWKVIQAANSEGQNHTRIHRNLIVIMPLMQPILDRSSKGSLMRGSMEQKFAYEINQAYIDPTKRAAVIKQNRKVCISKQFIRAIINEALGQITDFDENADFYANGVDSAACTRIRSLLNQVFRVFPLYASIPQLTLVQNISESQKPLPWNIVYDCGTISR
jgi:acyl-coenzyme A synthetase/AMP-(fatty) acid ligase